MSPFVKGLPKQSSQRTIKNLSIVLSDGNISDDQKHYTYWVKEQGGILVKYKSFFRCAKVYKGSTFSEVLQSYLRKHRLADKADSMAQSQLLIGMNMGVTTARTVGTSQTVLEEV